MVGPPDPDAVAAWRELREGLLRFVRRRVRDEADAEDIVHDVLLRVHMHRDALRDESRFRGWLYGIARNAIIDHYRARRTTEPLDAELAADIPMAAALHELAGCVMPLVERLPELYREAVVLSEIEGYTQKQTAERLGLSLSGAKSRVQRGRARLEQLVHECCRIEFDSRGGVMEFQRRARTPDCGSGCGPVQLRSSASSPRETAPSSTGQP